MSAKAIPDTATNKRLFSWVSCNQPKGVRRRNFLKMRIIGMKNWGLEEGRKEK
jgi:hypothetical protein